MNLILVTERESEGGYVGVVGIFSSEEKATDAIREYFSDGKLLSRRDIYDSGVLFEVYIECGYPYNDQVIVSANEYILNEL